MKAIYTPLSRELRKHQTPWEAKLWRHLRGGRFDGCKFKRQVPIGNYIVDFCCQNKKLIIELDGSGHNHFQNKIGDIERQSYLEARGYLILRFWNNQIDKDLEAVLEKIFRAINK
jgi:very-short-patch-repair endonuclease